MKPVCYFGDDQLDRAAIYLAGIMSYYDIPYDHVSSLDSPPDDFPYDKYSAFVLSDYPRSRFGEGRLEKIAQAVMAGAGLVMIGGWESFRGRIGEYDKTILADVLPVVMGNSDDRRNCSQPTLIRRCRPHPILEDLPWQSPAGIGGYNLFKAKRDAETLLDTLQFEVAILGDNVNDCDVEGVCDISGKPITEMASIECECGDTFVFSPLELRPLLVVGRYGEGRTAAFASDVAPHWVGGFVDWGRNRISQKVGEGEIEVGESYAQFFRNLLKWLQKEI